MLTLALSLGLGLAADWGAILGTEEGRPDEPVRVFGFVQPQVELIPGQTAEGLSPALAAYEDQVPSFNLAYGRGPWTFSLHRARLGVRGSVPKTKQRVSYFAMFGSGEVGLIRGESVAMTDFSVTFKVAPGARVRVGQFKLPVMEEIVPSAPVALEFVHFSNTLSRLLLENTIVDGVPTGQAWGFRDVGVQLFDGVQAGSWAASYALMVSNGAGPSAVDADAAKDVSGRAEVAFVTDGERTDPRREEIKVGGWWLQGRRVVDGEEGVRRMRRGAFVHVEQGVAWGLFEVAQGVGALEIGQQPPFAGSPTLVVSDAEAWGVVGQGGLRIGLGDTATLGAKARLDQYHQQTELPEALRVFRTATMGLEVDPYPTVRLQANLELRQLRAPDGSADAQAIAAALGPRWTGQATVMF
jgi:hypothetical protein